MPTRKMTCALLAVLLTCSVAPAAKYKRAELNIPPPQEREWPNIDVKQETRPRLHPGNLGQFYETRFKGTLDHCTKYRAHIKLPSGEIIAIPFFYMCVLDLSYIETQLTLNNMPKTVRDWTIEPKDKSRNLLIDIDAADLKLGRFETMKNKGIDEACCC